MLQERKQNRITVVVPKIDLICFDAKTRTELNQQILKLCQDYEIKVQQIFFVSSIRGDGIEDLKKHLNELARSRCKHKFIPKVFQFFEEGLKQKCASIKPILTTDEIKQILIDSTNQKDISKYLDAFLHHQRVLGAILFDQSKNIICTDPSR